MHDSARGSPEPLDGFQSLVADINKVLGPCNGIDSAGIDVEELKHLMGEYASNEADWERYAFADYTRGYTRNLVDNCNGKSNLVSSTYFSGSKFGCLLDLAHSTIEHFTRHILTKVYS